MKATLDPRLSGLYVVTDRAHCMHHGLEASVAAALAGGARLVQYRDKTEDHGRRLDEASRLATLCKAGSAVFIVNDDVRLARTIAAHGVHLGGDDMDIRDARALLGDNAIIGISCYNDFSRARAAAMAGADYIAFGSVFPSATKPDAPRAPLELFARARDEIGLPACAIGGIDRRNIGEVAAAGASMAAVVSAVFAADDITAATRDLDRLFRRVSPG